MAVAFLLLLSFLFRSQLVDAQSPITNTPVPPLQWIELTPLLSGPAPPGLKNPSIGYDNSSGTLLIFGGEANGFPVQQTYLLNVSSLIWSSPSPPNGLSQKPPPRSAAISGGDFAASNRHGHVVIGGKGLNGPLDDAWEFDYINQFWSEVTISPGGPSARYGASGGTDPTAAFVQDPIVPGPNNTFYLAGGFDGQSPIPLSDAWIFKVAGVLSPNDNDTLGSWSQITFPDDLPSKVRQAGVVMPSGRVIAAGGCSSADFSDDLCAQQDSHVLNFESSTDISPPGCPAPRVGAVLSPNYNTFSNSYASQAFMFLGLFNDTLWDDGQGLNMGEVDIFDVDSGTWTRLLPSGDPATNPPKFPKPREGAVAISSSTTIVGARSVTAADTIVFGGQDAEGNYLNDFWLLRAYMGTVTSTNESWTGFGDGTLQTGVDATGTGVTVQYLTTCATSLSPAATNGTQSTGSPSGPTQSPSPHTPASNIAFPFDTNSVHKILSPVSLIFIFVAVTAYRLSSPYHSETSSNVRTGVNGMLFFAVAGTAATIAFGMGVIGLILSFTSIKKTSIPVSFRRSAKASLHLKTAHGKAGLALFLGLYVLVPIMLFAAYRPWKKWTKEARIRQELLDEAARKNSTETGFTGLNSNGREPAASPLRAATPSPSDVDKTDPIESTPLPPRRRTKSLLTSPFWNRQKETPGRRSTDTGAESLSSGGPTRSFEVLNRGNRQRRQSTNGLDTLSNGIPRSLSDLDWLDRRRDVHTIGELDYALTQMNRNGATPPLNDSQSAGPLMPTATPPLPTLPTRTQSLVHIVLHSFVLGACVLCLVALWQRAPKATFAVFLAAITVFYTILLILAWHGKPRISILSVLLNSLKDQPSRIQTPVGIPTPPSSRPLSTVLIDPSATLDSRSPYIHQIPYRRVFPSNHDDDVLSSTGHGVALRSEADEDDEDDEMQRRIEQEMERREVSIVTVPKRRLWIANPS